MLDHAIRHDRLFKQGTSWYRVSVRTMSYVKDPRVDAYIDALPEW
jgi:hypothetical protein